MAYQDSYQRTTLCYDFILSTFDIQIKLLNPIFKNSKKLVVPSIWSLYTIKVLPTVNFHCLRILTNELLFYSNTTFLENIQKFSSITWIYSNLAYLDSHGIINSRCHLVLQPSWSIKIVNLNSHPHRISTHILTNP